MGRHQCKTIDQTTHTNENYYNSTTYIALHCNNLHVICSPVKVSHNDKAFAPTSESVHTSLDDENAA